MTLKLLVDGYNVVSPAAPPKVFDSMWLHRERMQLINRLTTFLPSALCEQTCVVFDAANPPRDRPSQFTHGGIDVRFAVGYPEADDLLEELIAASHHPKQLTVISSDHRIQVACRRRGATSFDSHQWLDDLMDGDVPLAKGVLERFSDTSSVEPHAPIKKEGDADRVSGRTPSSELEVEQWMREFGFDSDG